MKLRFMLGVIVTVALALPLAAQMGMGSRMPSLTGVWHPSVGSGAAYERVVGNGNKETFEITIVGKDELDGKPGYWMEVAMTDARMGGEMLMKELVTVADDGVTSTRMIMQMPGQQPMEMDLNSNPMAKGMRHKAEVDIRNKGEVVGTETITVPAGTFSCQHIREKDGSGDYWISDKISPWSLVKSQDGKSTMVLTKMITDAKDRITGTPTKFDPMQMMRNRMGQQGQQ